MVRMPTNNCPNVIDVSVMGHNSMRKHGRRSKRFVKNVRTDDDTEAAASTTACENDHQSSPANDRVRPHCRRHHLQLLETMNLFARGLNTTARAQTVSNLETSSKATTFNSGTQTFTSNATELEKQRNSIAAASCCSRS
ncbi:hypothetical protein EVAR_72512_1 [Eumeta japonica]|uniref:Uncharacterized protein n=1 Tax=Eumeta variegata TaxID=151549 RepID=A0A4C1TRN7_EUMVA|nr:hypothetical protein EVAR_72512_1 [Eumeta japonica]